MIVCQNCKTADQEFHAVQFGDGTADICDACWALPWDDMIRRHRMLMTAPSTVATAISTLPTVTMSGAAHIDEGRYATRVDVPVVPWGGSRLYDAYVDGLPADPIPLPARQIYRTDLDTLITAERWLREAL